MLAPHARPQLFVRRVVLVAFLTLASTASLAAANLQSIGAALNRNYKGHEMVQRAFHSGGTVRYASDGSFIKGGRPGPWTLDASIRCADIQLTRKGLIIKGKRLYYIYDIKQAKLEAFPGSSVKIEIVAGAQPASVAALQQEISKVFVSEHENITKFVPDYWKPYLDRVTQSKSRVAQPPLEGASGKPDQPLLDLSDGPSAKHVLKSLIKQGFRPPKPIKPTTPSFTKEAERLHVHGLVVLLVTVETDGHVKDISIFRPVGMGLDDLAVKTIRKWRFKPASRYGKPIASRIQVEMSWNHF